MLHYNFINILFHIFSRMAKRKLNQSQRRKLCKAKAAAANLTGPPAAPTKGPWDAAIHRVIQPSARGLEDADHIEC